MGATSYRMRRTRATLTGRQWQRCATTPTATRLAVTPRPPLKCRMPDCVSRTNSPLPVMPRAIPSTVDSALVNRTRSPWYAWSRSHSSRICENPVDSKAVARTWTESMMSAASLFRETCPFLLSTSPTGVPRCALTSAPDPTLMPTPITATTGFPPLANSIRMPPTLTPSRRISLGHFSDTPAIPDRCIARATATPTTRLRGATSAIGNAHSPSQ